MDERGEGRLKLRVCFVRDGKPVEGHRSPERWRVNRCPPNRAKRLGVRQPSGAVAGDGIKRKVAKSRRRREWWPSAKTFASLRLCVKIGRAEINGSGRDAENGNRDGRAPRQCPS